MCNCFAVKQCKQLFSQNSMVFQAVLNDMPHLNNKDQTMHFGLNDVWRRLSNALRRCWQHWFHFINRLITTVKYNTTMWSRVFLFIWGVMLCLLPLIHLWAAQPGVYMCLPVQPLAEIKMVPWLAQVQKCFVHTHTISQRGHKT